MVQTDAQCKIPLYGTKLVSLKYSTCMIAVITANCNASTVQHTNDLPAAENFILGTTLVSVNKFKVSCNIQFMYYTVTCNTVPLREARHVGHYDIFHSAECIQNVRAVPLKNPQAGKTPPKI